MIQLEIEKPDAEGYFEGRGYVLLRFSLKGRIEPGEGSDFKVTFTKMYGDAAVKHCTGRLDGTTGAITGRWHFADETDDVRGPLYFVRTPPSLYRFRYAEPQLASNLARARWIFACAAVHFQIKQRLWSWKLMKERCIERRRYIELHTRQTRLNMAGSAGVTPLNADEEIELNRLRQTVSTPEQLLYDSIAEFQLRKSTLHT
jgi:hypothetical protein